MSQQYFTVLTEIGAAALQNSVTLSKKIEINEFAVGDGGGPGFSCDVEAAKKKTRLVRENYRGAINKLTDDPESNQRHYIEALVPIKYGGWMVREVAWYLSDGSLFAYTVFPPSYKSLPSEGAAVELPIRTYLITGGVENIQLKIDPTVILAKKSDIEEAISLIETSELPEPIVELFQGNKVVSKLNTLTPGERPTLKFERLGPATMFDMYGELVRLGSDQIRYCPVKGVLIESESENLCIQSNRMGMPTPLNDGTSVEFDVGQLKSGDPYHKVNFSANSVSRIYKSTVTESGEEGFYTLSMMLWCESGSMNVRLCGYDDNGYLISPDIRITDKPKLYQYTFFAQGGNKYIGIYNGTSDGVNFDSQSCFWCNAQLEKGKKSSSYIETNESPVTRPADTIYIEGNGNFFNKDMTIVADVDLMGGASTASRDLLSIDEEPVHVIRLLQADGSRFDGDTTWYGNGSSESVKLNVHYDTFQRWCFSINKAGTVKKFYLDEQEAKDETDPSINTQFNRATPMMIGGYRNARIGGYIKRLRIFHPELTTQEFKRLS